MQRVARRSDAAVTDLGNHSGAADVGGAGQHVARPTNKLAAVLANQVMQPKLRLAWTTHPKMAQACRRRHAN